jgi:hypothetical protein
MTEDIPQNSIFLNKKDKEIFLLLYKHNYLKTRKHAAKCLN